MLHSYAQNLEDVVLWRALKHVKEGAYVDVGAADPEIDSVTKSFYELGWRGVHIEPVREFADKLRADRPHDVVVEACAGPAIGSVELYQVSNTGLSTTNVRFGQELERDGHLVEVVTVPMRRLDAMLSEAGLEGRPIHFLKIDVEGAEGDVLRGLDLDTWRPWVVLVESTSPRSTEQNFDEWEHLLVDHGYEFCLFDGLNRFYVAKEHEELKPKLSYPACVFDQPYVTDANALAMRMYEQLHDEHERVLTGVTRIEEEYERTLQAYVNLESEWKTLVAELDAVVASKTAADEEIVRLGQQVDQLRAECSTYRAGVARMSAELDRERTMRDEAQRQLGERDARIAQIEDSTSWRLTAPLRRVVDRGKRVVRARTPPRSAG